MSIKYKKSNTDKKTERKKNTDNKPALENISAELIKPERIWEVDFVRGVAILCVLLVHIFSYLDSFSSIDIEWLPFFFFVKQRGGTFFLILSGLSCSLANKTLKRGLIVFGLGMTFTAATQLLIQYGVEDNGIWIPWGVLHMIGFAMIVYPLFKKLDLRILFIVGVVLIVVGYRIYYPNVFVEAGFLFPLGLCQMYFSAFDYFPIMPFLGWFLIGNVAGKILYREKKSLLPNVNKDNSIIKFLCFCGRTSLQNYYIHNILLYIIAKQL